MKANSSIPAVLEAAKAAAAQLQYRSSMLQAKPKSGAPGGQPPQGQPDAKGAGSK